MRLLDRSNASKRPGLIHLLAAACLLFFCRCAGPIAALAEASALTIECVEKAAREMDVPVKLLWGILAMESGAVGSANENTNGSFDFGPMQINSIWLPEIRKQFNVSDYDIRHNGCLNVRIGAWILAQQLQKDPSWAGVAAYHSKTPRFAAKYLQRLKSKLATLDPEQLITDANTSTRSELTGQMDASNDKSPPGRNQPLQARDGPKRANDPNIRHVPPQFEVQANSRQPPFRSVTTAALPQQKESAMPTSKRMKAGQRSAAQVETGPLVALTAACVEQAARQVNVSLSVLMAVLATEPGEIGKRTRMPDGTFEYGPMRISSQWMPLIKQHLALTEDQLINDGCLNVRAGAWILKQHIEKDPTWLGVAAYRAQTPELAHQYLARLVTNIYSVDIGQVLGKINLTQTTSSHRMKNP